MSPERPTTSRRRFLLMLRSKLMAVFFGLAVLAPATVATDASAANGTRPFRFPATNVAHAEHPGAAPVYSCGVVSGPDLTGPADQLLLNVCLSVGKDGTGVGTVGDAIHPSVNAHLAVQQFTQQGSVVHFAGVVSAANDPARVGRPFEVIGDEARTGGTHLVLLLEGAEFTGSGLTTAEVFQNSTNRAIEDCHNSFPLAIQADLLNRCIALVLSRTSVNF
jgi:hypothetical protein